MLSWTWKWTMDGLFHIKVDCTAGVWLDFTCHRQPTQFTTKIIITDKKIRFFIQISDLFNYSTLSLNCRVVKKNTIIPTKIFIYFKIKFLPLFIESDFFCIFTPYYWVRFFSIFYPFLLGQIFPYFTPFCWDRVN